MADIQSSGNEKIEESSNWLTGTKKFATSDVRMFSFVERFEVFDRLFCEDIESSGMKRRIFNRRGTRRLRNRVIG